MITPAPEHPFQPGDRIYWPGPAGYGFGKFAGRLHCVERAWTDPHEYFTIHYVKLIGIEKPVSTGRFRLVKRAGGVPV